MLFGRPIGFLPEDVDDPNWELNAYVEDLKGTIELQDLLKPEDRLPERSLNALKESLAKATTELKELDEKEQAKYK